MVDTIIQLQRQVRRSWIEASASFDQREFAASDDDVVSKVRKFRTILGLPLVDMEGPIRASPHQSPTITHGPLKWKETTSSSRRTTTQKQTIFQFTVNCCCCWALMEVDSFC
jgi:hypothetical protein